MRDEPDGSIAPAFNKEAGADLAKLQPRERQQYERQDASHRTALKTLAAENERLRDERVKREVERQLKRPALELMPGGRRSGGVDPAQFTPEKQKAMREQAERTVREQERLDLAARQKNFERAQERFVGRQLEKDRAPGKERE